MKRQANQTADKVLKIVAECITRLDQINRQNLLVNKMDEFEISLAVNMLKSVLAHQIQVIHIEPST
ncbi:hypothetical protein [Mucilaginibacter sp.]|uniref:hypothetical protein n=1 Tax=Mucilaginibacter sp. TaxID=1882438 RepID=UPI003D10AB6B